ncbi:CHAD domain-containing protein [Curtobacterium sp. MCBA15_001]|uniref:CHAD domain-containing protein n=1 Tax=Curtobacterium sp. MCBA15_001 TaxID=1898731 RepID=UPI0008DC9F8D|nr:CHAD domain-containing protein [Curtobacterium sp. MCBA15_001]OIH97507.1 hypothetical protein BIU90_14625 [Curtobacterium sp. MCBA15_001]
MDTTTEALADPRRTWRIPDDRRLPVLEPYADQVRRHPAVTVREALWDTADRALAFAGAELAQPDPPEGAAPEPLDRGSAARDAVEVVLRGRPVAVVRIRETTTSLVHLVDADGRLCAEVADVRVDEGDPDTMLLRSARWWALSDDGQPGSVVRVVERALSDAAEDVGRGPGDPVPTLAPVRRPAGTAGHHPARGSARAVVRDVLVPLRAELLQIDPMVRIDAEEAVHAFRKVLRRIRSVLAAYRGALDPGETEALRDVLRATARVAGVARDAEVLRAEVRRISEQVRPDALDPDVLGHLRTQLDERHFTATTGLVELLRTPVWFDTLDALDRVVDQAPAGPRAEQDAVAFTSERIAHERRRVRARLAVVDLGAPEAAGVTEVLVGLHALRKAVRRLRYALEAAGDLHDVGPHGIGRHRIGRLVRVQDTLGDVLDAHLGAEALRELARVAARSGIDTFGYGVLAATDLRIAEDRLADARRAVERLPRAL